MIYFKLAAALCILFLNVIFSQVKEFEYIDPLPEAANINKETNIIISPGKNFDFISLYNRNAYLITGDKSGAHSFRIVKGADERTIILKPDVLFSFGEKVSITFCSGIKRSSGKTFSPFTYSFYIRKTGIDKESIKKAVENETGTGQLLYSPLPSLPNIIITYTHFPSPGKILLSNIVPFPNIPNTPNLLIINNDGTPYYHKQMNYPCYDFNKQPNGRLTYYDSKAEKYFMLDENYSVVDSFYTGNGYKTDLHELRLQPNGNAYMMSYDTRVIDTGGGAPKPLRSIIGLIIQEIDANKNVIFQWRSWDHFRESDATHENLNGTVLDYCHGNAIEIDHDGNIIISSRNMDEITKINRSNGNIIWRFGGKNNQFTFTNDTIGFSHQHAIRRLKNGNLTMFDNGNFHTPPFSRAIEYHLDENAMTATLVWQYRHSPDLYAPFTGYTQRLDNGNTIIGWGFTPVAVTEVRYDGTKEFELTLPQGVFSYRAFRYEWNELTNDKIVPSTFELRQNYPNPFNPETTIKFQVPQPAAANALTRVRLDIFDLLGRNIGTILDEEFPAGTYSVKFNGSNLASGVYFYSMFAGSFKETRKLVLVK